MTTVFRESVLRELPLYRPPVTSLKQPLAPQRRQLTSSSLPADGRRELEAERGVE